MALAKRAIYLLATMGFWSLSLSVVHKIGDSAGWTTSAVGNIDYNNWAATKVFHPSDILGNFFLICAIFEFESRYYNLIHLDLIRLIKMSLFMFYHWQFLNMMRIITM